MTQVRTIFRSFFVAMMLAAFAMPASAKPVQLTITATFSPPGAGTFTCTPNPVLFNGSSTCTASANPGFFLSTFSNCSRIGTTNQCTLSNVTTNKTVTAAFAAEEAGGPVDCSAHNYAGDGQGVIDPDNTYVDLDAAGSGDFGIRRGPNYVASTCGSVGVSLTKTGNTAKFVYDKTSGQLGAFKYSIVWDEVAVDTTGPSAGWTQKRLEVCWGAGADCDSTGGLPNWVPALACADDDLTLTQAYLMPVIPNEAPFNTGANTLAQYSPGAQAKMCVALSGWKSNGRTGPASTDPIKVIYFHKVVDEADGGVRLSN